MIEIKPAASLDEVQQAKELVCNVFESATLDIKALYAALSKSDPSFTDPTAWVVAKDSNRIVGAVRMAERVIRVGSEKYTVAGITSTCVDKNFQKKGIGAAIMERSFQTMKEKKQDVSILFGRRAVDGFYGKLGYFSVGAYPTFQITTDLKKNIAELKPFNAANISQYKKAYEHSIRNLHSTAMRTDYEWNILWSRLQVLKHLEFSEIRFQNNFAGYMIKNSNSIFEISVLPEFEKDAVSLLSMPSKLNPMHPILNSLEEVSYKIETRYSYDGGQMMKLISDRSKQLQPLSKIRPGIDTIQYFSFTEIDEF